MLVRERRMAPAKASRPSVKLAGEGREIGGEAFAEPRVVPVLLGDRIAKPLVRDLVRQQTEGGTVGHAAFAKEDGAGVLNKIFSTFAHPTAIAVIQHDTDIAQLLSDNYHKLGVPLGEISLRLIAQWREQQAAEASAPKSRT